MQDRRRWDIVDLDRPRCRGIAQRLIEQSWRRCAFQGEQCVDCLSSMFLSVIQSIMKPKLRLKNTLGKPPIGAAFTNASRIFRAICNCSSCPGLESARLAPFSMAYLNTFGISSGRLRTDKVTPAMKYHECSGSCGCPRIQESSAGVAMTGSVTDGIACEAGRKGVGNGGNPRTPTWSASQLTVLHNGVPKAKQGYSWI